MADETKNIEAFFAAWGAPDEEREQMLRTAVADDVTYQDPQGEVAGVDALCVYVAQFTANAPGSAAEVAEIAGEGPARDVRVRFHGAWGEMFGRYLVTLSPDSRVLRAEGLPEGAA